MTRLQTGPALSNDSSTGLQSTLYFFHLQSLLSVACYFGVQSFVSRKPFLFILSATTRQGRDEKKEFATSQFVKLQFADVHIPIVEVRSLCSMSFVKNSVFWQAIQKFLLLNSDTAKIYERCKVFELYHYTLENVVLLYPPASSDEENGDDDPLPATAAAHQHEHK